VLAKQQVERQVLRRGVLVLRDPCAEALEDREPWPCVGVSASSEEAWNPGSETATKYQVFMYYKLRFHMV
jgi:hypothetical protein